MFLATEFAKSDGIMNNLRIKGLLLNYCQYHNLIRSTKNPFYIPKNPQKCLKDSTQILESTSTCAWFCYINFSTLLYYHGLRATKKIIRSSYWMDLKIASIYALFSLFAFFTFISSHNFSFPISSPIHDFSLIEQSFMLYMKI